MTAARTVFALGMIAGALGLAGCGRTPTETPESRLESRRTDLQQRQSEAEELFAELSQKLSPPQRVKIRKAIDAEFKASASRLGDPAAY